MEKLDKVIAALECCTVAGGCSGCPYYEDKGICVELLIEGALARLKELDGKYRAALEVAAIATEKLAAVTGGVEDG